MRMVDRFAAASAVDAGVRACLTEVRVETLLTVFSMEKRTARLSVAPARFGDRIGSPAVEWSLPRLGTGSGSRRSRCSSFGFADATACSWYRACPAPSFRVEPRSKRCCIRRRRSSTSRGPRSALGVVFADVSERIAHQGTHVLVGQGVVHVLAVASTPHQSFRPQHSQPL